VHRQRVVLALLLVAGLAGLVAGARDADAVLHLPVEGVAVDALHLAALGLAAGGVVVGQVRALVLVGRVAVGAVLQPARGEQAIGDVLLGGLVAAVADGAIEVRRPLLRQVVQAQPVVGVAAQALRADGALGLVVLPDRVRAVAIQAGRCGGVLLFDQDLEVARLEVVLDVLLVAGAAGGVQALLQLERGPVRAAGGVDVDVAVQAAGVGARVVP